MRTGRCRLTPECGCRSANAVKNRWRSSTRRRSFPPTEGDGGESPLGIEEYSGINDVQVTSDLVVESRVHVHSHRFVASLRLKIKGPNGAHHQGSEKPPSTTKRTRSYPGRFHGVGRSLTPVSRKSLPVSVQVLTLSLSTVDSSGNSAAAHPDTAVTLQLMRSEVSKAPNLRPRQSFDNTDSQALRAPLLVIPSMSDLEECLELRETEPLDNLVSSFIKELEVEKNCREIPA